MEILGHFNFSLAQQNKRAAIKRMDFNESRNPWEWWQSPHKKNLSGHRPTEVRLRSLVESLELAAVSDHNVLAGLAGAATVGFDLLYNVEPVGHGTENHVLAVEPCGLNRAQEELGTVCVRPSVGHAQDSGAGVLELEVLVFELLAVDRLAAGAVSGSEIATLTHEVVDHSVETGAFVAKAFLSGAESAKVLGGLGHDIGTQGHFDAAERFAVSSDVKKANGIIHRRQFPSAASGPASTICRRG